MVNSYQFLVDFRYNAHATTLSKIPHEHLQFLTQRQQVKMHELPKIQVNDPLVMFYGYEVGDVVISHQACESAGESQQMHLVIPQMKQPKLEYFGSVHVAGV